MCFCFLIWKMTCKLNGGFLKMVCGFAESSTIIIYELIKLRDCFIGLMNM